MATNNPIELLITLGVNESPSTENIQTAINNIKKNLNLEIDIKATKNTVQALQTLNEKIENILNNATKLASAFGNVDIKISSSDEKKIKGLTDEIQRLKTELNGLKAVNGNIDASGISKAYEREFDKVRSSARRIDDYISDLLGDNGKYTLFFGQELKLGEDGKPLTNNAGIPTGETVEKLQTVVKTIKNDIGEIETFKFRPIFDDNDKDVIKEFKDVGRILTDTSSKDLNLNTEKLETDLKRLRSQGKLTSDEFEGYMGSISKATDNIDLDNIRKSLNLDNINNTGLQKYEDTLHDIYKTMLKLRDTAILTQPSLDKLTDDINSLDKNDTASATRLLNQMKKDLESFNYMSNVDKEFKRQSVELENQIYVLDKLEKKYRDTFDGAEAEKYRQQIENLKMSMVSLSNTKGKELTLFDLKDSAKSINDVKKNILDFKESTVDNSGFTLNTEKLETDLKRLRSAGKITSDEFKGYMDRIAGATDGIDLKNIRKELNLDNIDAANLKNYEDALHAIYKNMLKLRDTSILTQPELDKLEHAIDSLDDGDIASANRLLDKMKKDLEGFNYMSNVDKEFKRQSVELENQIHVLDKLEKKYRDTFDGDEAGKYRQQIENLKKSMTTLSNTKGKELTLFDLKDSAKSISDIKKVIHDFKEVTVDNSGFTLNTEKLETDLKRLSSQGKLTSDEFTSYMNRVTKAADNIDLKNIRKELNLENIDATEMQKYNDAVYQIDQTMRKLRDTSILTDRELNELGNKVKSLDGSVASANELLAKMKQRLDDVNYKKGVKNALGSQIDDLEQMENTLTALERKFRRTFDPEQATEMRAEIARVRAALKDVTDTRGSNLELGDLNSTANDISDLTRRMGGFRASVTEASRASVGLVESFRIAMTRFPIWMAASSAYYAVARGIQNMTEQVIMLDTAVTNLRRVMDIEDYKFNNMVEEAIVNVDALSGKTEEYMKLVGEFGRTGLDDTQSLEMANVATMMQNISELNADEAFNTLTTAMIVFKDELNSTVDIADKLNEVDNNFAITTKDLSLAMNKAASTAKTFGVSLDQLVGYTTAIGSATRESGNIVGNGLKTIMSRMTTNRNAVGALEAIGVAIEDLEGNVRPVADIIDEVARKWHGLTDAQRQNASVGIAGTHQLTRWNALMLNYDMAIQATETSMNSFNSATREQEKYNQSLEARINRLSTAWTSFSNSAGNTVVYDTIVVVTEALNNAAKGGEGLMSVLGLLGPVLGVVSAAIVLASTKLRGFITAQYTATAANVKAAGATGVYAMALTGLGTAATLAKHAIRGLAAATIIGLVFVGVGIVLEKVIKVMSENIQKQEEFESYLKSNISALSENRDNTMALVDAYKELSAQDKSTWDTEKKQEYLKVQQQLAEVFPGLIDHIDNTGLAHLKSSELIDEEIKSTEELVEAQHRLNLSEAADDIKDIKDSMDGKWYDSFDNFLHGSLEERIKYYKGIIKEAEKQGVDTSAWDMELLQLERQYQSASAEIKSNIFKIVDSINYLNGTKIDPTLKNNVKDFVAALDLSGLDEEEFAEKVAGIMEKMQKALNNKDAKGYSNAVAELNELASTTAKSEPKVDNLSGSLAELNDEIKKNAEASGLASVEGDEFGESAEEAADAFKELTDSLSFVNGVLEEYAENNSLSASTMLEIMEEYPELIGFIDDEAQLIRELTKIRDEDVNTAKKQLAAKLEVNTDFYNQNLSALEQFVKQQFSFYDKDLNRFQTLAQAKADVETELINRLARQWGIYYSETSQEFILDTWARDTEYGKNIQEANRQLKELRDGFTNFTLDRINLNFTSLGTSLDKNTKSTKKNNKATKESIYYTDKYKQKIEELTLAIEKQKNIQSKYPEYHDKYIKATQTQIKLEKQKLQLMKEQAASLDKQIKSGKIKETGSVQTTSTTKTTSTNRKLSGWGGTITDTFGTYRSFRNGRMHTGVDIAGSKGTRLDSNVSGKVINVGKNSLSGNFVQILDANGMKHFYGHLNSIAVAMNEVITVGKQIGTIGNTGNVYSRTGDGSHLHYEIKNRAGKNINPMDYVKAAKKNQTITSTSGGKSASTIAAETAKSIDDAKSALNGLYKDILTQQELIAELEKSIIDSNLARYENKRKFFDDSYNYEEAKIKNVNKTSERYNATISKQIDLLAKKRSIDKQELAYINKLIKRGGLSAKVVAELTERQRALNTSLQDTTSTIAGLKNSRISNNEMVSEQQASLIEYMSQVIELLAVGTDRYNKAVNDKIGYMKKQLAADEAQLKVEKQKVISGQYTGEALDAIIEKVNTLTLSTMALAKQIQDENYNLIVSLKVKTDELVDDNNFEIERSKLLQSLMVEGSANWTAESEKQIQWLLQSLEAIDKQRHDMQQELFKSDITADQVKQITEDLEDLTIAYWNTKNAIESTNKEIEDIEKSLLEDIYNELLNGYKDYIGERRDEHMKAIDDELEVEQKAHDERLKMLEDELDAFKKVADDKLRILERTESERDYNMEIDELTTQRTKIQEQINRLSLENTNEAKAKRKKLQEELDKIDKDIAEKRHDRDIELQKQAITDSVEAKEEEIAEKQELEDGAYDELVKRIDKEKQYWEKHYTDLLNDERKFAQLREDVMSKNFSKISSEFSTYITNMQATMPLLEDTLDGTMEAVGTAIRTNIIENLEKAIALITEFNAKQTSGTPGTPGTPGTTNPSNPSVTDPFDPNKDKEDLVDNTPPPAKTLSNGDMKVLLAKYMKEQLVLLETKDRRKTEIRRKADVLAAEGRAEGSTVPKNVGLNEILSGYSKDQLHKFSQFAMANKTVVMSDYLQKYITEFAKKIASMDTGGYINTKGSGIDGKGGALSIVHPHEVILDKVDTKSLIDNIGVMDNMVQAFKNTFANIKAASLLTSLESGQQIVVEVTGDNYYNNGQDADKVFNKIVDGIRRKGGRL